MKRSLRGAFIAAILIITLLSASCGGEDFLFGDEGDITYVAIGASDALGVGAIPEDEGYVFRIEDELDDELEEDVELCGLCLVALPAAELDQIKELLEGVLDAGVEPDLVTILVGANDILEGVEPEDYESDLRDVLNQLRDESPDAIIVIGNVPDMTQIPRFMDGSDEDVTLERIIAFNEVIESLAQEFNLPPVVDLFSVMITDDFVAEDGFHPSDEGHQIIADLFIDVIFSALGVSP